MAKPKLNTAERKKIAKALDDYLKPLFETNNRRAVLMPSMFTKNKITVDYYEISTRFPNFLTDREIQEMVWRKGYFFRRGPGSAHFTVTVIEKPSATEKFPGFVNVC